MVHRARRYHRVFKIAALERMAAGESVSALSRQLGIRPKLLYRWRDAVQRGAIEALRVSGGRGLGSAWSSGRRSCHRRGVVVPRCAGAGARAECRARAQDRPAGAEALQLSKQAGRAQSASPDAPMSTASWRVGRG